MKKSFEGEYSNRFKAKLALQANDEAKVQQLSEKYSIPASIINSWVDQLEERAELLFMNDTQSGSTDPIKNQGALLQGLLEASPNGIVVTDLKQNAITYNKKCIEMWNMPGHIVASGNMEEAMQHFLQMQKNPEVLVDQLKKISQNPELEIENILELKDGRFLKRHSVPYLVGGQTVGRITNFVDITVFKKTEERLSKYGNLLSSINTNVNEGILRSTPDDGLIYVNDAFVNMFGYDSKEEVLATDPAMFYADEGIRGKLVDKLKEGQFKNEEVLFKRKDGSTFWGLENSTLVESDGQIYIDGVVSNIDNWKKAEQSLRKSEEKYRTILTNIEEGYFETNVAGDLTFFNATLVEMLGYEADELLGKNNREYMDGVNAGKVYETFNRVYKTGRSERGFGWKLICSDGSRLNVEASVTLRKDVDGNPIGFSGMVRDVTERKRKEKQIRESLREKEVLLGEIHHRVKNNLAVISGLLYLQADKTADKNARKALLQSQTRINSIALIHELLYDNQTFSRLNPNEYIKQLVEHISANLSGGESNIQTNIEAENFDLEMRTAIPCALIINELITNAYKYAFKEKEQGTVNISFNKSSDGIYKLTVTDDGVGLPDNFSIEDKSKHSLGLYLVKTLTRQLQGELSFKNGSGATFVITFPEQE